MARKEKKPTSPQKKKATPPMRTQEPLVQVQELPITTRADDSDPLEELPEEEPATEDGDGNESKYDDFIETLASLTLQPPVDVRAQIEHLAARLGKETLELAKDMLLVARPDKAARASIDTFVDTMEAECDSVCRKEQQEMKREALQTWPEDADLPEYYIKRALLPCPKCRAVRTKNLSQAVVTVSVGCPPKSKKDLRIASLRCRVCGHVWQMPVREI